MTDSAGAEDPPTRVDVPGGQGVQVGNDGSQHNKYIQTNIESLVIESSPASAAGQADATTSMVVAQLPGARPSSPDNTARTRAEAPRVWNVPSRLATFTGRRQVLNEIRRNLERKGTVAVTALHGLGGVGKTQLAIEYAWRHADSYELVWWIDAEQPELIGAQIAGLAEPLGLQLAGLGSEEVDAVLRQLRLRDRWLLVFDNAQKAADVRHWLPSGDGHVLITSRNPAWGVLGHRVDVKVMNPAEAAALLKRRVDAIDTSTAAALAEELGFLPLALAQAAAYLERTCVDPRTYLKRFRSRQKQMLSAGADLIYQGTVDSTWLLTLDRLAEHIPAAAVLLQLCAFCAPEPIPLRLFHANYELLPDPLGRSIGGDDPSASLDELVAEVLSYSLARRTGDTLQLHRLTQAVIAAHLPPRDQTARSDTVAHLLATTASGTDRGPANWQSWAALGPHLRHSAARLGAEDPHGLRSQVNRFCLELLMSGGQYQAGQHLAAELYASNAHLLGDDHPDTLESAELLAHALWDLGDYENARVLAEDTFTRRRRVLGEDDQDTLNSANTLSIVLGTLGENQAAMALIRDTYARRRRVYGEDDIYTLASAHNLAEELALAGDHEAARSLDEDTLVRRRRVLGDDHTATLYSMQNFASRLDDAGEYQLARTMAEDTLSRRRRVLGDNHPDTLDIMNVLATILDHLGERGMAREIAEDALARYRQVLGDNHPLALKAEAFVGGLY